MLYLFRVSLTSKGQEASHSEKKTLLSRQKGLQMAKRLDEATLDFAIHNESM